MSYSPYPYEQLGSERYTFYSIGIKHIEKVVDFIPVGIRNIINLGFGDLRPDGESMDTAARNFSGVSACPSADSTGDCLARAVAVAVPEVEFNFPAISY